jgi:hypothetical protein
MKGLDQTRYTLDQILERQKPDECIKTHLSDFHNNLAGQLQKKYFVAKTHKIGISYFANDKKAFLFLNVCQQYLSLKFFTGHQNLNGMIKGIWLNKNDNLGCKPFRVKDKATVDIALGSAIEAHKIAEEWGA